MKTVGTYLDLITSEHADKPKFIAVLTALLRPLVDVQTLEIGLPALYDVDVAVGVQLDAVGLWVGVSRYLSVPLPDVWFSFDTVGLGFDEGVWFGPDDNTVGVIRLEDAVYRKLIYAKIGDNQWNGETNNAYVFLKKIFDGPTIPIIQDYGDMSMAFGYAGTIITDPVLTSLLTNGYLDIKPAGVRMAHHIAPSVDGPLFGFDVETDAVSGFDVGGWAILT